MEQTLIAATEFSWLELDSWIAILKMVVGFGFIIFVHEAGHFLVAKACGVKCEKFYVGFDAFDVKIGDVVLIPRRLFYFTWGETEYGIGIIPLGGYVKMLGQDDNPANQEQERQRTMAEGGNAEAGEPAKLDPRSYPAKSVAQRFAIISAGVIMNLIFAVIFAAIAFGMGAPYEPAVIGNVTPGGPAWRADVLPGTQVLRINEDDKPADHLRWQDLSGAIALTGIGHTIDLTAQVPNQQETQTIQLVPEDGLQKLKLAKLGSVGIEAATSNQLAPDASALFPGMSASRATPPLEPGDQIVAVGGRPTPYGFDLRREFALYPEERLTLTVIRPGKRQDDPGTELQVVVEPQPLQGFGLHFKHGPIRAIQTGSPAEAAGLQVGDRLETLDGEPIGDPLALADRMAAAAREGREVRFTLRREGETEPRELAVKPRLLRTALASPDHLPMGIDELGITLELTDEVGEVVSEGPASAAGVQPGDRLVSLLFLEKGEPLDPKSPAPFPRTEVLYSEFPNLWSSMMDRVQFFGPDHSMRLTLRRGEQEIKVDLRPTTLENRFARMRGITLQRLKRTLVAKSFGEAMSLGLRETKEDATQVYQTLKQMLLGRVSAINLRGPGTIAAGATLMAMEGNATFLLFLALISANLAVVNFLPIPVLDGGHAMFLLYEAIFRRPVPEKLVFAMSMAGLFFLLGLMLFVLTMDVFQWIIL